MHDRRRDSDAAAPLLHPSSSVAAVSSSYDTIDNLPPAKRMSKPRSHSKLSTDSDTLALLGKKQVLKRRFGFWSLFAFAVCELITWETVLALFGQGYTNGGPAGLVWGFLIAWPSTLSVYIVISELASMAPIASGQYYWVSPAKYHV